MTELRRFEVKSLARVEGEGSLRVRVADGRVEIAEFSIYEPPRFFEKLVRGRAIREVPDLVARICGICPVAYQLTACIALEQALGIAVTPEITALRRLLYHGEWIQSHGLHVHLLHAPDFFGVESGIALAASKSFALWMFVASMMYSGIAVMFTLYVVYVQNKQMMSRVQG